MRYLLRITVGLALLVACVSGRSMTQSARAADAARRASPKTSVSNESVAEKLVRKALEAELAGNTADRASLLEAAIQAQPELPTARWHSGQVQIDKRWLAIDDVARGNAENARLAEYRRRRDLLIDTADGQRELARWCTRYHLADEAAVHWRAVLSFAPDDAEAIRALKLKMHNGRLMAPRELAAASAWDAREKEAARKWQPQIMKWRDAIVKGTDSEKQAAIEGLKSIRDPAAISTLRGAFLRGDRGTQSPELYGAYVNVLAEMPDDEATQELLRCVLAGDSQIAAAALKGRPLASFVPQLIAALPVEVKLSGSSTIHSALGVYVTSEQELKVEVPDALYTETQIARNSRLVAAIPGPRGGTNGLAQARAVASVGDLKAAAFETERFQREVAEQQRRLDAAAADRRQLIEKALLASTNFEQESTREGWLSQLNRALETYTPARLPETGPASYRRVFENVSVTLIRGMSCFPAGTLVETQLGSAAIETLKPGDRVLSQDIETGELAYQAVREVTLRPAVTLVEIEAGGETIRATRGHPFWVNGQGWLMAKHLKAGQDLHTPDGPLQIERIGEQPAQEAYNLVVSDFATYFVGEQKILVHDNQPLTGTGMLLPGLAARDVKP